MRSRQLSRTLLLIAVSVVAIVVAYTVVTRYVLFADTYGSTIPEYAGSVCYADGKANKGESKTCTTNTSPAEIIRFYRFYFTSNRWTVNRNDGGSPSLLEFRKNRTLASIRIVDSSDLRTTYSISYSDD